MFQSKLIKKYKNISHGFFNNLGGHSIGIYKSLNCGIGSKDKKKYINANLKKVCKKVGCLKNNLVLLKQIHSNSIYSIKKCLVSVMNRQHALRLMFGKGQGSYPKPGR